MNLLADDPVQPEEDRLDRRVFGRKTAELLEGVARQSESAVAGLIGPWGSGKTSLLGFVEKELPTDWKSVRFTPWALSDLERSIEEFFTSLLTAFPSNESGPRIRERLRKYARAVVPIAHLVPGVGVGAALEAMEARLGRDPSIDARHQDLKQVMHEANQKIVVVVDDIDRLHPEELLLVFKLVRLVGRLPGVYYLLAFDEESLIDVLAQTDIAGGSRQRAQRFIEKIVQIRIDIPPLHTTQTDELVNAALSLILTTHGIEVEPQDWQDFGNVYHDHLRPQLGQPRAIKRYFAQADAYWSLVSGEVSFVDFLLLTFLRTFYPSIYRVLPRRKSELVVPRPFFVQEPDPSEVVDGWHAVLKEHDVPTDDRDAVIHLLAQLFPPLRAAMSVFGGGAPAPEDLYRRKKAGSADYFDRYFQFGVPSLDVPDQVVARAVRDIAGGELEGAKKALSSYLSTSSDHVLSKMMASAVPQSRVEAARLFHFVSEVFESLRSNNIGLVSQAFSAKQTARRWGGDLLLDVLDGGQIDIGRVLAQPQGDHLLVWSIHHACRRLEERDSGKSELNAFITDAAAALQEHFFPIFDRPVEQVTEELWLLGMVALLEPGTSTQDWFRSSLDGSGWSRSQLLGAFVSIGTSYGSGPPESILGSYSGQHFEALVGRDQVISAFWEAGGPVPPTATVDESDVSLENRVRRARLDLQVVLRDTQPPAE